MGREWGGEGFEGNAGVNRKHGTSQAARVYSGSPVFPMILWRMSFAWASADLPHAGAGKIPCWHRQASKGTCCTGSPLFAVPRRAVPCRAVRPLPRRDIPGTFPCWHGQSRILGHSRAGRSGGQILAPAHMEFCPRAQGMQGCRHFSPCRQNPVPCHSGAGAANTGFAERNRQASKPSARVTGEMEELGRSRGWDGGGGSLEA